MNDYDRIELIIHHLEDHFQEQPDLDSMAALVGLSAYHFHRIFRRWAGTTPKSFLQHLTAVEAGRLLREGHTVLDTAYEVGLSGPGRLHDLCIRMEAASPGEIRAGGAGWKIRAGFADSPFGEAFIAEGPRGICRLSFIPNREEKEREWAFLEALWPAAIILRDDRMAGELAGRVFHDPGIQDSGDPIPVHVKGTAFQLKVWRALIRIPFGEVCRYADVGKAIGKPTSSRAVGTAVGNNPVSFLIPCHRVIQSSGLVGNYHWGGRRKKAILTWERLVKNKSPEGDS